MSEREREVLAVVGEHLSNAQIASRLHISVRTVESHVSSLLRKFGVADRRALAELAPLVEAGSRGGPGPGVVARLPAPRTTFIGREREQAVVVAALAESRLVSLVGPGGVGKTRLAVETARTAAASYRFGGGFVDLVPVRGAFVAQTVAAALGVRARPQQPLEDVLCEHLARGRSLLVFDNCEHLLTVVAALVERLLIACPELTVLATSRERLAVAGERTVQVPPMSLLADVADEKGAAGVSEAEVLFLDRARALDPQFTAAPVAVQELCARLDGIPLAIELAAARSASLGVDGLMAGLDDRLRLLTGGRGANERHRSLDAVIGWSHDLLDDDERALFCRLAVFAGGFDLDAAVAVAAVGDRGVVADLTGRLADKSLLARLPDVAGSRWRLLETIRAYALHKLAASGAETATRGRHLRWAADTAAGLEYRVETGQEWQAAFDAVADDLRAAAGSGAGHRPDCAAHQVARCLGHLAYARWFLTGARQHYQHAATIAPTHAEAAADLSAAADVAMVHAHGDLAFELSLASADRTKKAGNDAARAVALAHAVTIANRFPAQFLDRPPDDRLCQLLDEANDAAPADNAWVAAYLAVAAAWDGRLAKGHPDAALGATALGMARAAGDPVLISGAQDALAATMLVTGRLREADRLSQERMRLLDYMPRHDPRNGIETFDAFHSAIECATLVGDLPGALAIARRAQADDALGRQPHVSASKLIIPLVLQGGFDDALAHADRMWDAWQRARQPPAGWMAAALYATALIHGLRGNDFLKRQWAARAEEVAGEASPGWVAWPTFARFAEPRIALHAGRIDDALATAVDLSTEPSWHDGHNGWYDCYAWGIAAEVAVTAKLPGASRWLAAAAPVAEENDWVAACLARAAGLLHHDHSALEESITGWERIGARFERACTLLHLKDRTAEGRAELRALGCLTAMRHATGHPRKP